MHGQEIGDGYLVEYASRLGLDVRQFLQDLSREVHITRINQNIETGIQSKVTVIPALFVNRDSIYRFLKR
jgi:predicted DsbA family dithiol-disulfide isomerase